jgi:hypothetical protein
MTQQEKVLAYLKSGRRLTHMKAMMEFSIPRLAAVVHALKQQGHDIKTNVKRTFGNTNYTEYFLA